MITYILWGAWIKYFNIHTDNFEKISTYALLSFASILTIPLDILTVPFQLTGIIIFLITNKKKKDK